ncbi:MAG: hypothetical protein H8E34_00825 [Bacteroidetes bacterium]|nr:hypothetical protein [Bacteroidota bacterium]
MKQEIGHTIKNLTDIKDFILQTRYCPVRQFEKTNTQNKRNAKRTDLPTIKFCITLVFIPPLKVELAIYSNDNDMLFRTILTNNNGMEHYFPSNQLFIN